MKRWASLLPLLALVLVGFLMKPYQAVADDSDLAALLLNADALKNTHLPKPLPGGIATSLGPQFDASCLNLVRDLDPTGALAPRVLEAWVTDAATRVMKDCASEYPELETWISEWATAFRRDVIRCGGTDGGAEMDSCWLSATPQDATGLRLNDQLTFHDAFSDYKKRIAPGYSAATEIEPNPYTVDTLIHENFHATHINSLGSEDHGTVSTLFPTLGKASCSYGILDDRVYMVSQLCSRHAQLDKAGSVFMGTAGWLYARTQSCGVDAGCVRLFSSKNTYYPPKASNNLASGWLYPSYAKSLCDRIQAKGQTEFERMQRERAAAAAKP